MARSTRKTTTKKNSKTTAKKVTRKTSTSKRNTVTRKKSVSNKRTKKATIQEESYGWEILPFVVAVIVSILVVLQSISSTQSDLALYPTGGHGRTIAPNNAAYLMAPYHGAASDCFIDGAQHLKIQASERAIERSMNLLQEAQMQHEWNCSTDPNGTSCTQAKDHLAEAQELIMDRTANLERARVEACW